MTCEIRPKGTAKVSGSASAAPGAGASRQTSPRRQGAPPCSLTVTLSATPRGARLARRLAAERLHAWGWSYDSDVSRDVALVVAELAANAVHHGSVPGRDFRFRIALARPEGPGGPGGVVTVRVEVTDTRPERRVPGPGEVVPPPVGAASGRGLALVDALGERWGSHGDGVTKTVWCELDVPAPEDVPEEAGFRSGAGVPPVGENTG